MAAPHSPAHVRRVLDKHRKHCLVAGAGPVGSLTALYLAQRGHKVDVIERRGDMRQSGDEAGRSINLALSRRGWKALDAAGVGDIIREKAIPMHGRVMHAVDGALTFQPYGQEGQYINAVSRGLLNRTLMSLAEEHDDVNIHFHQRVTDVMMRGPAPDDGVSLVTEVGRNDGSGEFDERTWEGDLVFGVDGAFSAVRQAMMTSRPRVDYSCEWLSHGYKELVIPAKEDATGDERFRIEKNALHIWPRGRFMLIALPNLDGSFTCTLFLAFKDDQFGDDGEGAFETLDTPAKARAFFEKTFPDALEMMPTFDADWEQNPVSSLGTIRVFPWQWDSRVVLLGDASHAIVPFYGQGLVSGFEDVFVMGELLDAHTKDGACDFAAVFPAFEDARKKNGDAIGELALGNFVEMRDKVADPRFLLQKKIEGVFQKWFPGAYLPLYSMVTFSDLPYAEALARGKEQDAWMQSVLNEVGPEPDYTSAAFEEKWRPQVETFLSRRARRSA